MMQRRPFLVLIGLLVASAHPQSVADRWWAHVQFLGSDALEGRDTGSDGYRTAARYVAAEFQKAGLEPAGTNGYLQPIQFRTRRIVEDRSSLALVRNGQPEPVTLGADATLNMRIEHAPQLEAPVVFAGHGLVVPEAGYDDLSGLDLRGKVVMFLSGGPARIPGPLLAHYQSIRWSYLKERGAIGTVSVGNPRNMDIPWERSMLTRFMPALVLADPALDETAGQKLSVTLNPARADKFLAGSGHTFKEIVALADAGKPLPTFPLPASIRARVSFTAGQVESPNVVALLTGTDPVLGDEYVVLSAHLDHVGIGEPANGDRIYNGVMDNASGVAGLLETAAAIRESGKTFKRSLVFLAVTGEEKGLLGSRHFALNPTVAGGQIVANINTDMFLPIIPMTSVTVAGVDESDLAGDVRAAAQAVGVEVVPDPEPERNIFTRSDQYQFIKRGVPAIFPRIGYRRDSPEHEVIRRWTRTRYHGPTDDLSQPIDFKAAADFNRLYLAIVESVANRPVAPRWNPTSFFRRFAR